MLFLRHYHQTGYLAGLIGAVLRLQFNAARQNPNHPDLGEGESRRLRSLKVCSVNKAYVNPFLNNFILENCEKKKQNVKPPFRSLKSGVPPSTFPPSGTKSSSITPAAGDGT